MRLQANGMALEVDDQGPTSAPAVLLVHGLGMQLIDWPDALVQRLRAAGLRVIRFDNRDAGLSQILDAQGVPHPLWWGVRQALHLSPRPPYSLADMARDTVGLLDALGLQQVHLVGASMGGMIAQHVAADWPERVKSLTLMMTTAGAPELPQPDGALMRQLFSPVKGQGVHDIATTLKTHLAPLLSVHYLQRLDDHLAVERHLLQRVVRGWHPQGTARQAWAVVADGDRTPMLARIQAPTEILHGEADPLVPVAAAHHLAAHIAGAHLDVVEHLRHDLPEALMERFARSILAAVARAV